MIVAGDECRRTQQGNNNAYCQDNAISWFDWKLVKQNADLLRFVQTLIRFRRSHVTVRRKQFLTGHTNGHNGLPDVAWFGPQGQGIEWSNTQLSLMCLLSAPDVADDPDGNARDILLLFNSTPDPCDFQFPEVAADKRWRLFIDTANPSPKDIYPNLDGPEPPESQRVTLTYRSFVAYVAQ